MSVVYAGAMFIAVMDQTIVNVALAAIGRQFHTSATAVAGAVIGYQVSVALFIPAAAWLGDRFGPRQVLLGAIAVFTAASALCGLAGSLDELVAFRVLQGAGGGLMTPVGLTMLFRAFPQAERVRASAILVIPTALAPAVGPVIGGLFVTDVTWRWVFYVNVPVGLFALLYGVLFLADQEHPAAGRFDVPGFVTSSLGLGLLMYGVAEGPNTGWTAAPIVACIAAGAMLVAAMVVIELRTPSPLLDLRVYADRLFRSASIVLTLTSVAFFGLLFLLSLFFQDGLHFSAVQAGSTICPEAFGVIIASQVISRRIYPAVGPRRIMVSGLLLIAAIAAFLSTANTGTSVWLLRAILFVMGFGVAAVFLPSQAAGFATVGAARTSVASTVFNAQRMIGGAIGVALLTAVITALHPVRTVAGHAEANIQAFHTGLIVCAGVAVAAALAALTVSDRDAAPTMIRQRRQPPAVAAVEGEGVLPAEGAPAGSADQ
ncbi:MAG TPA: DHA2 family efflux MFS transporter permease subunit [Trebonia sp.]|nr:DHA2 family efflux MFS transporter permease subunit [Trebonia sp.]